MMEAATTIPVLMAGRFVVGIGVGIASLVCPVYLAEISPQEVRGVVVAIDILMITLGQFLATIICLFLDRNWRMMLGLAGVPSAI